MPAAPSIAAVLQRSHRRSSRRRRATAASRLDDPPDRSTIPGKPVCGRPAARDPLGRRVITPQFARYQAPVLAADPLATMALRGASAVRDTAGNAIGHRAQASKYTIGCWSRGMRWTPRAIGCFGCPSLVRPRHKSETPCETARLANTCRGRRSRHRVQATSNLPSCILAKSIAACRYIQLSGPIRIPSGCWSISFGCEALKAYRFTIRSPP